MPKEKWTVREVTSPKRFELSVNNADLGEFTLESTTGPLETWQHVRRPELRLVFYIVGFGDSMTPIGAKDIGFDVGDGKQRYLLVAHDTLVGKIRRSRPKERVDEPVGEDVPLPKIDDAELEPDTRREIAGGGSASDPEPALEAEVDPVGESGDVVSEVLVGKDGKVLEVVSETPTDPADPVDPVDPAVDGGGGGRRPEVDPAAE